MAVTQSSTLRFCVRTVATAVKAFQRGGPRVEHRKDVGLEEAVREIDLQLDVLEIEKALVRGN